MPVTYAGRIEARCVVPTGGAAISATIANGGSAATVTVPAASYFLTAAGSVSSLLTTLESQLNDNVQGYPQTAAAMAAAVGYGAWDAGYLLNETSGNPASVFGAPATLTPAGTPTYGSAGPRAGIDKAVGLDSSTDAFSFGNTYDVTATDDIAIAWVGYHAAIPAFGALLSKYDGGTGNGYQLVFDGSGLLYWRSYTGAVATDSIVAIPIASWYVGIAAIDRSTGKMCVAVRTLAGSSTIPGLTTVAAATTTNAQILALGSAPWLAATTDAKIAAIYIAHGSGACTGIAANMSTALTRFANAINAAWTVSMSTTTGLVTIDWSGYTTPTWSLSWTSTDLRDLLGFTANISSVTSAQTGTKQARGLWFPDSPLNCDDHPSMAPEDTDLRSTESPTGLTIGLSGNVKYVHTNARWDRVPVDRIREASATYANASLEVFFRDCISGLGGHAWFTPLSPLQVYWSNAGTDALLGADANDGAGTDGWCITGLSKFSEIAKMSQPGFAGQFNVRLPRLVSEG